MNNYKCIIVIGPTGAGKTPLGEFLEHQNWFGRRCYHFDFGANLRRIAASGEPTDGLSRHDVAFIRNVLISGALLENEHFWIAQRILESFARNRNIIDQDLIILNGLPRHVDQAFDVDGFVEAECLLNLQASPEVVRGRITENSGGDRTGRSDDSYEAVAARLERFHQRTRPLLDYYRSKKVAVIDIPVTNQTVPQDIMDFLSALNRKDFIR